MQPIDAPTIPDVEYRGKVRASDPEPSWDAAALITRDKEAALKDIILAILEVAGPITHEQIHDIYREKGGRRTLNRVQTATKELERAGLVKADPVLGRSLAGNPSTRWLLA